MSEDGRSERKERDMRDREEMGRKPVETQERELAEGVTERRDREAREEAERIEKEGAGASARNDELDSGDIERSGGQQTDEGTAEREGR